MRRNVVGLACVTALFVLTAATAQASHYPIEAVPFIKDEHKTSLAKLKVFDTEELLTALLTPDERKKVARKTGIEKKVLQEYVQSCDLLRVRGVGPKMARLLILSDVDGIKVLRAEKAETLLPRMQEANKKHGVSELLPQPDTLKDWIHQARKLKIVVK